VAVEHCLVSLRNERKLVPARAEHAVEHGGRTYCFASEKAAEVFRANPPRYLPAFEGLDPVRLSDGERRAGSLQHALWFRGRLYLFASPSTQAAFEADPADYAE
jgi:YHS domain-containing protein